MPKPTTNMMVNARKARRALENALKGKSAAENPRTAQALQLVKQYIAASSNRTATREVNGNAMGKAAIGFSTQPDFNFALEGNFSALGRDPLEAALTAGTKYEATASNHTADAQSTSVLATLLRTDMDDTVTMFMYDLLDMQAMQIIDFVIQGGGTVANLTKFQLSLLYRYFYRTNPFIAQVIDTHTDLLMSKARIDPPVDIPEILRDYVVKFFNDWIRKSRFNLTLRDLHRTHNVQGYAYFVLDDDTRSLKNELTPIDRMVPEKAKINEEDADFLAKTEEQYSKKPESVDLERRLKYLHTKCLYRFEKDYKGPDRTIVYGPLDITRQYRNRDTGYESIFFPNRQKPGQTMEELAEQGVTGGWLSLMEAAGGDANNLGQLQVDNNIMLNLPFMTVLERPDRTSLIHRVLHDAFIYEITRRAQLVQVQMYGKAGRIYKAPNASRDQLADLEDQIAMLHDDPTYMIVTNFDISIEEVGQTARDQTKELVDGQDKLADNMTTSMGLPKSFTSNESQYSGANITLEVINVVYNSQKDMFTQIVNEEVFKPVAIRKGLVILDEWGDPQPVYPKLTFTRMALRDDAVTQNLFNLYQKGSLPVDIIYEIFNLDSTDVMRALKNDAFTLKDPVFNDLIRDVYGSIGATISASPDIADKIYEALGIRAAPPGVAPPGGEGGAPGGDMGDLGGAPGEEGLPPEGAPGEEQPGNPDDQGGQPQPGITDGINTPDTTTDNFTPSSPPV